jgi:ELWxxDGT repeat protein
MATRDRNLPQRSTSFRWRGARATNGLLPASTRLQIEQLEDRQLLSLTPEILLDIGMGGDFNPSSLTSTGPVIFFLASDDTHGSELWKTDGTSAGTVLVKDIAPGSGGASIHYLTNVNGTLFFQANDGSTGRELWKSDGTAAGTVLVKDILIGPVESIPNYLTNVNGTLFFSANDGSGIKLWRSDGTATGTVPIPVSSGPPINLTNVNGTLFYTETDFGHLYKSDGTPSGTSFITKVNRVFDAYYGRLTNFNGTLFFPKYDSTNGYELWKTDGTAGGTVLVKDICPGVGSSLPANFVVVNGTLFFTANDGASGVELWKTDGTTAGTILVKDIRSGSGSANLAAMTNVAGTLFFSADDGSTGSELWKSDGSAAGTVMVRDICPGSVGSGPATLTNVNGTAFFAAQDGTTGFELWKSDGTSGGTMLVTDISQGSASSAPTWLINHNGTLIFAATDQRNGLWKSDGTAAGTSRVADVATFSSKPHTFTNVGSTIFFAATDRDHGIELWKTDGTPSGTELVKDIRSGISDSSPSQLINVGGILFFTVNDGTTGTELWRSDGGEAGTVIVKDIRPGTSSSTPRFLTDVGGTLFFAANDGTSGYELWKSDGTVAGTVMVKDLRAGSASSNPGAKSLFLLPIPGGMQNVGGTLFFSANDGSAGYELWKSDGTAAGTTLVKDIRPGSSSSGLGAFVNVNSTLFFTANDGSSGYELWKSDGSVAGTTVVADIRPGSASSINSSQFTIVPSMINVSGSVFFVANGGTTGGELWKSDGSVAGTMLVRDINPGTTGSSPSGLVNVSGKLFFIANDGTSGVELWKSDGTTTGTTLVKDISAGATSSAPTALLNVNGVLCFSANNGTHGQEPWRSDGSDAGTVLMMDINAGSADSTPGSLATFDGTLYLSANDDAHGFEPWTVFVPRFLRVDPTTLAQPEGAAGTIPFVFTVSLSAPSDQTVTVSYFTSDGSATVADNDYAGISGTLTYAPGQTTKLLTVLASGDVAVEPDDTFTLNLSDPVNASLTGAIATATIVNDEALITTTRLFYKGSTKWDVTNGTTFSDDNAIAPDKTAYLPGVGTSTFSAVSSYDKGINGLMVDLSGAHGAITVNDFVFKRGNNNTPSAWVAATAPATVTTRAGAGASASDRIELLWNDNDSVKKQWLEVIVKGNDTLGGFNTNTGLLSSYVFYFGSAIGDAGVGNSGAFQVTTGDEISARNNPKSLGNPATRSDVNDFNRNGLVDSADQIIARNNVTNLGNQLKFLVVGAGGPFAPETPPPNGVDPGSGASEAQRGQAVNTSTIPAQTPEASRETATATAAAGSGIASALAVDKLTNVTPNAATWLNERLVTPESGRLFVDAYFQQLSAETDNRSRRAPFMGSSDEVSITEDALDTLFTRTEYWEQPTQSES